MFEMGPPTTTAQLREWVSSVGHLERAATDAERVDRIRLLEELKSAAAAAQAAETVAFADSQERRQRESDVPAASVGEGVSSQVGLAKRESPARAQRYLGWSRVLTRELPGTFEALAEGRITEWRAQIVARETIWLSAEHRLAVDAEVAEQLEGWGDRRVEAEVKRIAYRLDPRGYVERAAGRAKDRRVTLMPAPETMSHLSGYLPVAQGVAVFASLKARADALRAQGDERSRDQIMADTLVERMTGQAHAEAAPVEVSLVMTDQALFNTGEGAQEPAHVAGFGPIPADLARQILLACDARAEAWVRRLYTNPDTGQLASIDARRRFFDGALRQLLIVRDQWCRTPWCDAPIRHADHVVGVTAGGETEIGNGQGLCQACNQAKEAPGWRARPVDESGSEVETTTPTGHRYRSRPAGRTPHPRTRAAPAQPPGSHLQHDRRRRCMRLTRGSYRSALPTNLSDREPQVPV